jgi:hypothetical protein
MIGHRQAALRDGVAQDDVAAGLVVGNVLLRGTLPSWKI